VFSILPIYHIFYRRVKNIFNPSLGLSIFGSKEELACRLEEQVQIAGGYKPFDPSPVFVAKEQTEYNKQDRGRKRKVTLKFINL
jgi:hypothetical protein